jgi:hypothetical protein
MAYQNGTVTNPTDLLQKLATFIVANGWTQDMSQADGTGWRLHAHKGVVYINLKTAINTTLAAEYFADQYSRNAGYGALMLYGGTGFASGTNWRDQAGAPKNATTPANTIGAGMVLPQGAIAGYHFFADSTGDNIVVVVEKTSGIFAHCGWGTSLNKLGTWTGGPYFFGSTAGYAISYNQAALNPGFAYSAETPGISGDPRDVSYSTTFIRADVDAFTGKWIGVGSTTTGYAGYTGKVGRSIVPVNDGTLNGLPSYSDYYNRLTSKMTGQSLMLPVRLLVDRDTGGSSFVGSLPNIFLCNAWDKGYTAAAEYLWGTDTYMVFPGPQNFPGLGYAIKKV